MSSRGSVVTAALEGAAFPRASVLVLDRFFPPALELITEESSNGTLSTALRGDAPPGGMRDGGWNVLAGSGFKECN